MVTGKTLVSYAIALGFAGLMATPIVAHHSFAAEFDEKKPIQVKGSLTGASLVNPHGWLHIDVTDDAANRRLMPPVTGKAVDWALEMGGANALFRRGWRPRDLPVGRIVLVEG